MDKDRFAKQVAVAAGVCFLCGFAPRPTLAQNSPSAQAQQTPQAPSPAAQSVKDPRQKDVFEGLQFSDEQKAKISAIRRDVKSRMDAVARDDKLDQDQKNAMLEGYRRLENGEIFKVLTPDQQKEVRQRVQAQHAAQQQQKDKQTKPMSTPTPQ